MKTCALATFYCMQAAVLLVGGCFTLWWIQELTMWLIWVVGEERALGARNVLRIDNGGTLLTNPARMMLWSVPFWVLGLVQISAAFTLFHSSWRRIFRGYRAQAKNAASS